MGFDLGVDALSDQQLAEVARLREEMWSRAAAVPPVGMLVPYLGRDFYVPKGVFWPHEDSKALVRAMRISVRDDVLDLGTGSGVIAIFAALMGAKRVLATDIDSAAVTVAKHNAKLHGVSGIVRAIQSDLFDAVPSGIRFDVITANLPFSRHETTEPHQRTMYDPGLNAWQKLFGQVNRFLKPNGRLYVAQANFGNVEEILDLAERSKLGVKRVGRHPMPNDPRVFYAFLMEPVGEHPKMLDTRN
jgi:release factor glutamine methyltransferase